MSIYCAKMLAGSSEYWPRAQNFIELLDEVLLTELISQVNSNENTMKLNLKTFQKIPKTIFPEHFFRKNPKFSESVRTHPNAPRRIRMHPNVSEHVQTGPNRSEHVRKLRKTCENIEQLRENVEIFRETCEIFSVTSSSNQSAPPCRIGARRSAEEVTKFLNV